MGLVDKSYESKHVLDLLGAVEGNAHATQRRLSTSLGVALGLTNGLIKRCVRKGLIKVTAIPAGRYGYYLTPQGFAEKSRLTAEYLKVSFDFFRQAREETAEALDFASKNRWHRIALAGAGEMAEIATISAREGPVELVAILEPGSNKSSFCGVPVVASPKDLAEVDAIMITDIRAPQRVFGDLSQLFPTARILTPPMLRILRNPTPDPGDIGETV